MRALIFFALIIVVLSLSCSSYTDAADGATPDVYSANTANLLFQSGFEKGVYLGDLYNDEGATWFQDIKGSDYENFFWPINLWRTTGTFQVLVDSWNDSREFIHNEIVTVKGHSGNSSRVMQSTILKDQHEWTQDPYIFLDAVEDGDLYISYWLRFPDNIGEVLGDGTDDDGWCTFFEWKTSGDYRTAVYVYVEEGIPYWYVHGDNVAKDNYGRYREYWAIENRSIPVPEDEWFKVEFFWHRSRENDGRFWWAVNGDVIADYHGPNKRKKPIDRIMLFTTYSGKYPLTQWVDDIEIWDGFPPGVPDF